MFETMWNSTYLVFNPGPMILRGPGKLIIAGSLEYIKKIYDMQRSRLAVHR
jgi:hypothetical protein